MGLFWNVVETLCYGFRSSVLDRGRVQFQVGARVICDLRAIARLHLRRGYHPDGPSEARYFVSFVLRDGRQVPLGLSFHVFGFHKPRETLIGGQTDDRKIEAVMQKAATFIGVEYILTEEPDASLGE